MLWPNTHYKSGSCRSGEGGTQFLNVKLRLLDHNSSPTSGIGHRIEQRRVTFCILQIIMYTLMLLVLLSQTGTFTLWLAQPVVVFLQVRPISIIIVE